MIIKKRNSMLLKDSINAQGSYQLHLSVIDTNIMGGGGGGGEGGVEYD